MKTCFCAIAARCAAPATPAHLKMSKYAALSVAAIALCLAPSAMAGEIICNDTDECDDQGGGTPATTMYSIDTITDSLVQIDVNTGATTVIGGLGHDVRDVDLAVFDGRLFALNTIYGAGATLFEIDITTGAAVSATTVFRDGPLIGHAEGLAADEDGLIIGFANAGSSSNQLGVLGLNGEVTSVHDMSGFDSPAGVDFDALGYNAFTGDLISGDVGGSINFFNLGPTGSSYTNFGHFDGRMHDIGFISATTMIGLEEEQDILHHFDATTGDLLFSVSTPADMALSGVAVVPGPGALGLLMLAGAARRRRRTA